MYIPIQFIKYLLNILFQTANEENATLEKLKEDLFKLKLSVQPLTVVVGSIVNVQQTYVFINDIWFRTDSFLDSIVLTLKAFYAFDCAYPEKSKNLWQFLQIAGFEITNPNEKTGIAVRTHHKQFNLTSANEI